MQQLQEINYQDARVLTTKQLSAAFDTTDKTVTRNFQRNNERYEIGKHYFALTGEDLKQFKATRQDDATLKFVSTLYLWTEHGAWLHAKSLNNDRAWEAYRMLIDNYYSIAKRHSVLRGPDNMGHALSEQVIYQIESRLDALEEQIKQVTLPAREQKRLRNAVGERVYQLTRKEPGARPALFRALHRSIRERYDVESYRDVKRHQLLDALNFVANWGGEAIETRSKANSG
ncbi:ORF6N domain-containing protein [Sporosarcina newyorkensis]|uniref:ORF6C domain-containing protein n=1 Tax=Sporosarcina newyorkensis TaxID=759851 RepID=A0A1T4YTS8_9BACL|nr:ORF6N domain-containing protein [Sporosarcina newyorkensis]SKB05234.1 ORF6C domain-containing protein [Sporosarcina newyorkensis]